MQPVEAARRQIAEDIKAVSSGVATLSHASTRLSPEGTQALAEWTRTVRFAVETVVEFTDRCLKENPSN